jgi:hypothetical protein
MPVSNNPADYVCYCGLYCKMCATMATYPKQARALRDSLARDHWPDFGETVFEGFDTFWKVLGLFSEMDRNTQLCRGGCGNPECRIRPCAIEKGVALCGLCPEYPCEKIRGFADHYPMILKLNDLAREIGLEAWITEMESRAARGMTFKDSWED